MLRWTMIWTILAMGATGIFTIFYSAGGLFVWGERLRIAGGSFFFFSLLMGGIFTIKPLETRNAYLTHREDWSFLCLLVTISLFGISLLF